ncbi:phosphatidylinositol-glycan-specific phospholipase D [Pelodytes ibericus]
MATLGLFSAVLFVNSLFWFEATSCGISTHIEIAYRALEHFNQNEGNYNYKELLQKHPDAYQAGSVYPDAFYQDICMKGKYRDLSEDSHWSPFLKTSINYIRRVYPRPWSEGAQKLVAFLFGIASHMVADVSWHSLDIDQGFLSAMGKIDFHGSYAEAHDAGDFGSDVLSQFELDFGYLESKWYIPVKDLVNIYEEFYGTAVIEERTIIDCTYILFVQMYGESIAISKLFPTYARKSPFLVERFQEYFLGGVDDMAFWSTSIFQLTSFMLDNGTSDCYLPENPIFIQCNTNEKHNNIFVKRWFSNKSASEISSQLDIPRSTVFQYFFPWNVHTSNSVVVTLWQACLSGKAESPTVKSAYCRPGKIRFRKDEQYINTVASTLMSVAAHVTSVDTGIYIEMNSWTEVLSAMFTSLISSMQLITSSTVSMNPRVIFNSQDPNYNFTPQATYYVSKPYAKLGWTMTTADLNQDGLGDLIVGAPGYSTLDQVHIGRVYIVYGKEFGLPADSMDLDNNADVLLQGIEQSGRFGSSVAVLDFNLDGHLDLAVGAPSVGAKHLTYTGSVYVYFGSKTRGFSFVPSITIGCKLTYCNLGWTILAADVNGDKKNDLVIGSPYAPGGGKQRGVVAAFYSQQRRNGRAMLSMEEAEWSIVGEHDYAWFGYSLHSHNFKSSTLLVVGSPTWSCKRARGCDYPFVDLQSVGKVYGFYPPSKNVSFVVHGDTEQNKLGSSLASGILSVSDVRKQVLLIGAPTQNTNSRFAFISQQLHHAGAVKVYELNAGIAPSPLGILSGNREFARFGANVHLSDLDNDGLDEIIVTSPLKTGDIKSMVFGTQAGHFYVYNGNITSPGLLSKHCKSWSSPCPQDWAQYIVISPEEHTSFGTAVTTVRSRQTIQVVVAAERSSLNGRLAGAIYLYNLD